MTAAASRARAATPRAPAIHRRRGAWAIKTAGSAPEEIVGYWNKVKGWPGIYGSITWTPEVHDGFQNEEVIMCQANSLREGAFTLAPGYSTTRLVE